MLCGKRLGVNGLGKQMHCTLQVGHESNGNECCYNGCCYNHGRAVIHVVFYHCVVCGENEGWCLDCLREHEKACVRRLMRKPDDSYTERFD